MTNETFISEIDALYLKTEHLYLKYSIFKDKRSQAALERIKNAFNELAEAEGELSE
jgi:hypothetical protein